MPRGAALLLGLLLLAAVQSVDAAALCTWTGASMVDSNWSTDVNWSCVGLPVHSHPADSDSLIFPDGAPRLSTQNDLSNLALSHVAFQGLNYQIHGNAITLSSGISGDLPTGGGVLDLGPTLSIDVKLTQAQTFQCTGAKGMALFKALDLNGKTLTVDGDQSFNLGGPVSGAGGLIKNGTNVLLLQGANTYTGTTTINSGIVEISNDAALGASSSGNATSVIAGATLLLDANTSIDEPLTIAGAGADAPARGAIESFGDSAINGDIALTGASTINVPSLNDRLTVNGVIGGNFNLTKIGAGTLRLQNVNTYPGATILSAGTLELNGEIQTLSIGSTSTLSGNGVVGTNITLGSGGTLAPGTGYSSAALSAGSLLWEVASTMAFNLGVDSAHSDQLALTGTMLGLPGAGKFIFAFSDATTPPEPGVTYVLVAFASASGFSAANFNSAYVYAGTGPGASMTGTFALSANQLTFTPSAVTSDLLFRDGFE